jgi:hypothetical protein
MPLEPGTDFPFADTQAAMMLRSALDRARVEKSLSVRSLGKQLGYKQATVLSHMAAGRVAIPLDRAADIATAVSIPVTQFLIAAVLQKAPSAADFLAPLAGKSPQSDDFVEELTSITGQSLNALPDEHKDVIREMVADRAPKQRWLSLPELRTVLEIRRARPEFADQGLPSIDVNGITGFLTEG